jgi:hypothetical protein
MFEHAIDRGWTTQGLVRHASRPKRRRAGDLNHDLHFLTVLELEGGPPPVPPDVLGPVIRVVVLTAAMKARQSELPALARRRLDSAAHSRPHRLGPRRAL